MYLKLGNYPQTRAPYLAKNVLAVWFVLFDLPKNPQSSTRIKSNKHHSKCGIRHMNAEICSMETEKVLGKDMFIIK